MSVIEFKGRLFGKSAMMENMLHKHLEKPGAIAAVMSLNGVRIIKTVEGSHEIVKPKLQPERGGGE